MRQFALCLVLCLALLFMGHALAAPGNTLYIHGSVVNLREGPSTDTDVIIQLKKGHKLMEFGRQGNWVEVGVEKTGGKSGWIQSSLVGKEFKGGSSKAPHDADFENFKKAFNELNNKIRRQTGYTFFTNVENMGDGIVQVTASDIWLSAPRSDREGNLQTIFNMWEAAEKSDLPIAVTVVDKHGNQRMIVKDD